MLRSAYDREPAAARPLAAVHRELHALFKPDELARARTTRLYRDQHPAANAAAEAIVFYPTDPSGSNRPGNPPAGGGQ